MSTRLVLLGAVLWAGAAPASTPAEPRPEPLRIGIIGVDTSHAVAFTQILNDPKDPEHIEGARVVHAVRGGSPDIPASADRIDGYARDLHDRLGVEMLESLPDLVSKVDAILVLSVDGRTHLASARAVFGSGKPVFVNKPLAASYADGEISVILSNRYGGLYEEFLGTKGSLVLSDQDGAMLFTNEPGRGNGKIPERRDEAQPWSADWNIAYRTEIWAFCSAVRRGTPLLCGAERGMASAVATLAGHEAVATKTRVDVAESPDRVS